METKTEESEYLRVANNARNYFYDEVVPLFEGVKVPEENLNEAKTKDIELFIQSLNESFMAMVYMDSMLRSNSELYLSKHPMPLIEHIKLLFNEEDDAKVELLSADIYKQIMICLMTHVGTQLRLLEAVNQCPEWLHSSNIAEILGKAEIPLAMKTKLLNYLMYLCNAYLQ